MERIFAVLLLVIINVLEILLLLRTSLVTVELAVITFSLLLVLTLISVINKKGFWKLSFMAFVIHFLNIGYLFLLYGRSYTMYLATLLNLIGFLFCIKKEKTPREVIVPKLKSLEIEKEIQGIDLATPKVIIEEIETTKTSTKKETKKKAGVAKKVAKKSTKQKKTKKKVVRKKTAKKVVKKSKPRYVASTKGKSYHTTKCVWTNNIKRKNKVSFYSKNKVEGLGYKAHDCVPGAKKVLRKATQKVVVRKPVKRVKKILKYKSVKKVSKVKDTKKQYKPGKYVASTKGKSYHKAKCDWAKKIKVKNRVWFNSRQKAEKLGYEEHSCMK